MVILNYQLLAYGGVLAVAAFGIVNRVLMLSLMLCHGNQPGGPADYRL